MRKIQNIAFLLLATLFASCINDHIEPSFCRDGELSISVSTRSAGTRGQGDNDDMPTAESIVKDLQYFLYVKGSGEEAAPIYAGTITGITDNDDYNDETDRPTNDEDDNFSKTVQIPASALNQLFLGGATECEIYIIANYLENTMDPEHLDGIDLTKDLAFATRKNLKAIELNTPFYETPSSFVMDSEGTDIVSRGTGNNNKNTLTSGTIYLTRAAAKVMIEVNVQNAIDVSGNTWEPITQINDPTARKMFISFYNGVTTGVIDDGTDGASSTAVPTVTDAGAYYKVENVQLQSGKIGTDGASGSTSAVTRADESTSTSWKSAVDFYSYANSWTAGDEDHEPYFEISIPWRKKADGQGDSANWVTYTYTVPIAMNNNRFDRNKLYLIRLNVGALGDLSTLGEYQYSYVVLNWDEVTVDATLTRPKYFVVDEEYVEVYNEPSYSVDFTASDIVSAEILSIIKPDYSSDTAVENNYIYGSANNTEGVSSFSPSSGNTSPFTVLVDNSTDDGDGKSITLSHTLNNDMDSNGFDYVPYTVVVRATMTITDSAGNTSTMVKDITFKQYPAMYIKADKNTGGNIVSDSQADDDKGFVFVYNNQLYSGEQWQVVRGCYDGGTTSNKNPNMYVITTSVVEEPYILADPRSRTAQTGSDLSIGNSFNGKTLTYYYGSSTDNKYYLAPKFRIASSYGKCGSTISLANAKRRCAAYQEQGYPAGRWRVPTFAELDYIAKISGKGFIPHLFSDDGNYWSATSRITYHTDGTVQESTSNSNSYVRCVYDEWYWGSEPIADKTKFTWGDEKIW